MARASAGHSHPAGAAAGLEPAHRADDRRTGRAIPAEGGFYVWVRRAMGPFWGYQESWLSLTASIFDMAHLSVDLRALPGAIRPVAHGRLARLCLEARGSCAVLRLEPAAARRL